MASKYWATGAEVFGIVDGYTRRVSVHGSYEGAQLEADRLNAAESKYAGRRFTANGIVNSKPGVN